MGKRKPTEPRLWLAVADITELSTGDTFPLAQLSCYAHKTKRAGLNDVRECLEKRYPDSRYSFEIFDVVGVKWDYFTEAFSDFIDDDDDDGHDSDDSPAIDPDPEDHGVERVEVPELFANFINDLRLPDPA